MIRLGEKVFSSVLAAVAATSLAACGGASHSTLPRPAPVSSTAPVYNGPLTNATFKITIPAPTKASAKARTPAYISSATKSVRINMTASDSAHNVDLSGNHFNVLTAVPNGTGSSPGSPCAVDGSHAGNYTCTISVMVPPGSDTFTFTTYDDTTGTGTGASHILSQQIKTLTVVVGKANGPSTDPAFNIIFDANAATMAITTTSGFCAGSFTVANSGSVATVGTNAITFSAAYTDPATKTIVNPGLPTLTVNGHTDDNGGVGYTDPATHLNVKVNQSAQQFVLTQTAGTGTAAVSVAATPASGTDGLSFNRTLSFNFVSGPAPPASLLADAEQILDGNNATTGGVIHLWTVGGGGSSFSANTPGALSAQPPPGPANSDVDFPNDLTFDGNSDLLIANGGSGSPDFGNFACVPAGSITTTANNATILTNNLDDPTHLAFSDPRSVANGGLAGDSSVALSNAGLPASGGYSAVEFVLSGTYTAAATTRDVARVGNAVGISVAALAASPTNPAGSYAVSTFQGNPKTSQVQIIHPDGTTIPLTDTDIAHATLAYDKRTSQLIVVSDGRSLPSSVCTVQCYKQSNIQVWNVNPVSKAYEVKPINITDQPTADATFPLGPVDVSSDGTTSYVAVAVSNRVSNPELNVYTNSGSALTQVGSSLDYGASDCASAGGGSANYFYGGSSLNQNTVTTVKFLGTLNRLLVGLESEQGAPPSSSRTTANGMYIYDVTNPAMAQTGTRACDGDTGIGLGATTVNQTAFQVLSNRPLAAAYKP